MTRPLAFRGTLALITLAGLANRTAATLRHRDYPVIGDALTFHLEGGHLAHGEGFRRIFEDVPTAEHPPLFICLLAAFTLLGAGGILAQQLLLGVVGAATVVLVGLLGRRVRGRARRAHRRRGRRRPSAAVARRRRADERVAVRAVRRRRAARRVRLRRHADRRARGARRRARRARGADPGEALLLVPLLALATLVRAPLPGRARLAHLGALVAAFAVVLAPWSIRNALTFDAPVLISANADGVWAGANCEPTYYGPIVGSWDFPCYGRRPAGDEAEQSKEYRRRGIAYMRAHAGRVPVVLAARLGRVWDVYRPDQNRVFAASEGRRPAPSGSASCSTGCSCPPPWPGRGCSRRRRHVLAILLAPAAMVTVTRAPELRRDAAFRFAAEPSTVVAGRARGGRAPAGAAGAAHAPTGRRSRAATCGGGSSAGPRSTRVALAPSTCSCSPRG